MAGVRLALTTGDIDGIGGEVAAKALARLGPQPGVKWLLFRSPNCSSSHLKKIDSAFERIVVSNIEQGLVALPNLKNHQICDIKSPLSPAVWVEQVAKACMQNRLDGVATAPLSKTEIKDAGLPFIGHTEILAHVAGRPNLFMAFAGREFNVLLATGHLALKESPGALSKHQLKQALLAADQFRQWLPSQQKRRPIAVVGLNPHAGEKGLIGREEQQTFAPVIKQLTSKGLPLEGPLVPDAAFFRGNWRRYSVFVAAYHDQGLIPFKMVHGQDSGVHITVGLPFVRTSVDHGTAKDLFGKNKANPQSMIEAMEWAIRLTKSASRRKLTAR